MKITSVELLELRLPEEQLDAFRADDGQHVLLVKVHTDDGLTGVGEVVSHPRVAAAAITAPAVQVDCRGLAAEIVGLDPFETRVIWERLYGASSYHGRRGVVLHAMGGLDMALWDLRGKALDRPVCTLLGGVFHTRLRAYASALFPADGDEAAAVARRWREEGFSAVKLGWGPMGRDERLDVELVEGLRRGAGVDADIMIDAGCCWDAVTALRRARTFEEYDPLWLEEPLGQDDLDGYRWLNERTPVPVAAGEGEAGRHAWRDLIERGGIRICQIDLARTGFTEAMRIADMAEDRGCRVVNHFYSTGVNLAAGLHFAAARRSSFIFEYCVEETPTRRELTKEQMPIDEDGFVHVPDGPGLGVDLDDDVVDDLRV